MTMLLNDERLEDSIREERERTGAARWDEVWEGVYVVSPNPSVPHQRWVGKFVAALNEGLEPLGLGEAFPGVNVTDRTDDWTKNYRCPDVAVYLNDNPAVENETHFVGGPDLAVEIISPGEDPHAKLTFYASVGTRELLVVGRQPWQIELFRLNKPTREGEATPRRLELVGTSTPESGTTLHSAAVPFIWRLLPGGDRPRIAIACTATGQDWNL